MMRSRWLGRSPVVRPVQRDHSYWSNAGVGASCVPAEERVEEMPGRPARPPAADVLDGVVQGKGCGGVAGAHVQARLGAVAEIDRGVGGADEQSAASAVQETGGRFDDDPLQCLVHMSLVDVPAQARLELDGATLACLAQRRDVDWRRWW